MEVYIQLCVSILLNLKQPENNTTSELINLVFAYIFAAIVILVPTLLVYFLHVRRHSMDDLEFKDKYGVAYEDLKGGNRALWIVGTSFLR